MVVVQEKGTLDNRLEKAEEEKEKILRIITGDKTGPYIRLHVNELAIDLLRKSGISDKNAMRFAQEYVPKLVKSLYKKCEIFRSRANYFLKHYKQEV